MGVDQAPACCTNQESKNDGDDDEDDEADEGDDEAEEDNEDNDDDDAEDDDEDEYVPGSLCLPPKCWNAFWVSDTLSKISLYAVVQAHLPFQP